MKLKLDENGNVVVVDGKAVYVDDSGKDVVFDPVKMTQTNQELRTEAKGYRQKLDAATEKLTAFGELDPEAAHKAVETVSNLDAKKLIDAGEAQRVRDEMSKTFQSKLDAETERSRGLQLQLDNVTISSAFRDSAFIKDKVAMPSDFVMSYFKDRIKVVDGRVAVTDAGGNEILSSTNPGAVADFDEAMSIVVN